MQHTFEKNGAEIMPNASNKWKYNLRRSKKNDTKVIFDGDIDPLEIIRLSNEMQQNKSAYLRDEPKNAIKILHYFKKQVVFAKCIDKDGSMIGFRCALIIDDKAWDFYGATDMNGRKFKSGYLLLFELMNECKNRGVKTFNLGGVEFIKAPGVAKFKFDTGGEMYEFISDWEYSNFIFLRSFINFYTYIKVDTFLGNYSRSKGFSRQKKNSSN
jgi:lipid II:glycine glycyltransferase (peptidoglycan interpeptide bridge formation enzyme)